MANDVDPVEQADPAIRGVTHIEKVGVRRGLGTPMGLRQHHIDAEHLVTCLLKGRDHCRTDESGRARDQDPHGTS